jgi:Tol biopolymer transport system component
VSQRNQQLWDVIQLDLETGEEQLLAKNGNTPTWSADGRKVYFQKNVVHFAEVDAKTGDERVLFSSGSGQVKKGAVLFTPTYNAEIKKMAVTLHIGDYTTTIVNRNGGVNKIARGCQVTWNRRGDALYFVGHGGKMSNAFYLYHPDTGKSTMWLDLPGEYSHEYFPKLSNGENYLVFGASKGGHEHDSADYEIFLWQVGAPAESAARMTFHTGNDNWPDVFLRD